MQLIRCATLHARKPAAAGSCGYLLRHLLSCAVCSCAPGLCCRLRHAPPQHPTSRTSLNISLFSPYTLSLSLSLCSLQVPANKVKYVVGPGGAKIQEIQKKSKCRIQVQKVGRPQRLLANVFKSQHGLMERWDQCTAGMAITGSAHTRCDTTTHRGHGPPHVERIGCDLPTGTNAPYECYDRLGSCLVRYILYATDCDCDFSSTGCRMRMSSTRPLAPVPLMQPEPRHRRRQCSPAR